MGEKQDELEQLQSEFTEETVELTELEEKLAVSTILFVIRPTHYYYVLCLLVSYSFIGADFSRKNVF